MSSLFNIVVLIGDTIDNQNNSLLVRGWPVGYLHNVVEELNSGIPRTNLDNSRLEDLNQEPPDSVQIHCHKTLDHTTSLLYLRQGVAWVFYAFRGWAERTTWSETVAKEADFMINLVWKLHVYSSDLGLYQL